MELNRLPEGYKEGQKRRTEFKSPEEKREYDAGNLIALAENIFRERGIAVSPESLITRDDDDTAALSRAIAVALKNSTIVVDANPTTGAASAPAPVEESAIAEAQPERRASLTDTERFLEGRLNIDALIARALHVHGLWGLPRTLKEAGVIGREDQYEELLRTATTSQEDLPKISAALQEGGQRSIIVPPLSAKFGLVQLWNVIFSKLPHFQYTYVLNHLGNFRRLDPRDITELMELKGKIDKDRQRVIQVWKDTYAQKAQPIQSAVRLIFTPDELEVKRTGQSALADMQESLQHGTKYLDPAAHWLYLIERLTVGVERIKGRTDDFKSVLAESFKDRSIDPFIPDAQKITRYSDLVLPDGGVPNFYWNPEYRKFRLNGYGPDNANDNRGSRVSLG